MSRITVVLAVFVLLVLAQAGQAATLQEGWYVNLWTPAIFIYGEYGPTLIGDGYFYNTSAGRYDPFQIADPYGNRLKPEISVPETTTGVTPQQSLTIPFSTGLTDGTQIAYFSLAGGTMYSPDSMYLGLYRLCDDGTTETLWTQQQAGHTSIAGHVAYDIVAGGQFYFKLNVVPEPSAVLSLAVGCASLLGMMKRRGRK